MDARNIVQILTRRADDRISVGTGYWIGFSSILTAAHVVRGAVSVKIRFYAGSTRETDIFGTAWTEVMSDVAVVQFAVRSAGLHDPGAAPVGVLLDPGSVYDATAVGYPLLAWDSERRFRDTFQVIGNVTALSGARSSQFWFYYNTEGPPNRNDRRWEGMSGSPVWVDNVLIGVIVADHVTEPAALLARRLVPVFDEVSPALLRILRTTPDGIFRVESGNDRSGILEDHRTEALDQLPYAGIHGRSAEIGDMAEFCASADFYLTWTAGKWSGKTTLIRYFVAYPPERVEVISFFVNARRPDRCDAAAFLEIVRMQLAAVTTAKSIREVTRGAEAGWLFRALERGARECRTRGRVLVLLIDGLDEDRYFSANSVATTSIVSLLPARVIDNLKIIVTSRPYPPVFEGLDDAHPMLPARRELSRSAHVKDIERSAAKEIESTVGVGEGLAMDILGLLSAADSALAVGELADLTHATLAQVRMTIWHSLRLSVEIVGRRGGLGPHASDLVVASHETLGALIKEQLGLQVYDSYYQRLREWSRVHLRKGWTDDTPQFLERGLVRLLAQRDDLDELLALAFDRSRHRWLIGRFGGSHQTLEEIRICEAMNTTLPMPDIGIAARLAVERDFVSARYRFVSADMLRLLVRLSQATAAKSIANSADSRSSTDQYLYSIVAAQIDMGALEDAAATAPQISNSMLRVQARADIAVAHGRRGDSRAARAILRDVRAGVSDISPHSDRVKALIAIARAEGAGGLIDDVSATLDSAFDLLSEHSGTTTTAPISERVAGQRLVEIVAAQVELSRWDEIVTTAVRIGSPRRRTFALTAAAEALVAAGERRRAELTLCEAERLTVPPRLIEESGIGDEDIQNATVRVRASDLEWIVCLEEIARRQIAIGDCANARRTAERIPSNETRSEILISIAKELADSDPAAAQATFAAAQEIADRAATLAKLAAAQAHRGFFEAAERTAATIADKGTRSEAIASIAMARADRGDFDAALTSLTDLPGRQAAEVVEHVAIRLARDGRYGEARAAAEAERVRRWALPMMPMILARARADNAEFEDAVATLPEIANTSDRDECRVYLAERMIKAGLFDEALTVAQASTDESIRSTIAARVARTQTRAGLLDAALRTSRSIVQARPRAECLTLIAEALTDRDDHDRARHVLESAINVLAVITDEHVYAQSLAHIALAQTMAGDYAEGQSTIRLVSVGRVRRLTLAHIARVLAEGGSPESRSFIADTTTSVQRATIEMRHSRSYWTSTAFASYWSDPSVTSVFRADFLSEIEFSVETSRRAAESRAVSGVLAQLVRAYAETGDFARATELLASISVDRTAIDTSVYLARARLAAGSKKQAERTLADAVESALAVESVPSRVDLLSHIARIQALAGSHDLARESIAAASEAASMLESGIVAGECLAHIARAQAVVGDRNAAVATADAARTSVVFGGDDENSSEVLAHIAHAYSAAGELDSAREVLREAMGCASRADSMTLIALVAHRTGATELAVSAVLAALSCPGWPVALQAVALLDKNAVGEVAATYIEQAARMTATGKAQLT
ncbi:serine protease [Nocardia abscessus]|uniref:serine protease n=1 Tax=Nocardia abscessus TaxID=120957 RepID=UPI0024567D2A|nr:serine protease [Nocardia abscessus]